MKILVVRSSSMGDIVHALPVAKDIKTAFPECELDWVVEESFIDIAKLSPSIDNLVVTSFRRWRKNFFSPEVRAEMNEIKKTLSGRNYDWVIDIQGLLRSAWVCKWAQSPIAGYDWKNCREPLASLVYDKKLSLPENLGAVRRYRMAAAQTLDYEINVDKPKYGLKVFEDSKIKVERNYVALAVNTSRDGKLWPEEDWIGLGKALDQKGLSVLLFWGSQTEKERVERIAKEIPNAVVAPRSSLVQIAANLNNAEAVIGVDTGFTHLGAALGKPCIAIFVDTPLETVSLIGDGPCVTLGGVGKRPLVQTVLDELEKILL